MQYEFLRRVWAEVNLDRLADNVRRVRALIGEDRRLLAVVKANAYGHGDEAVVTELQRLGVEWFAVSNISEAIRLRKFGVRGDILILGVTPPEKVSALAYYNIVQAAIGADYAAALSAAASAAGVRVRIHIKLDTGMGRIGLLCGGADGEASAVEQAQTICALPGLSVEGLFTHFAAADSDDADDVAYTNAQQRAIDAVGSALESALARPILRHSMNSAGALYYLDARSDLARAGIVLYGQRPNAELETPVPLSPVMELKAVVSLVKELPAGSFVSYGRTCRCDTAVTAATIPVGYADGYPRLLSNKADVLIRGKRCRILGRVCMDQLIVDCTGVPVEAGDVATLFGTDGDETVTLDELAGICGTISYELICGISMRVPRVYIRAGEPIKVTEYL